VTAPLRCGYHCLLVSAEASHPRATADTPRTWSRARPERLAAILRARLQRPSYPRLNPPWLRSSRKAVTGRSAWAASRLSGRLRRFGTRGL